MWKNIKKFFKRVAECAGISWIARKVSSGWNSVKNWWSGSKVSNIDPSKMPKKPSISVNGSNITNEPSSAKPEPAIGSIFENQKGVLELFVQTNHTGKIFSVDIGKGNADLKYKEIKYRLEKYRAYIKCEKGEVFQITCGKLIEYNGKGAFLSIESIASQDGKDLSSELEGMKNMLGLSEKRAIIAVTQISKDQITVPKTVEDGNIPSSTTNNLEAQPHTADGHAM